MGPARSAPLTAREAGLVACPGCALLSPQGTADCPRCAARLHSRRPNSLQRVWAWWFAGIIAYIPANIYPMLSTYTLGRRSDDTIISGVIELIALGSWSIAFIVFFASVCIPLMKFAVIGWLAFSVQRGVRDPKSSMHLYEIVEFIGRWSMIDVFVVAILSALVQLGFAAQIAPGPAAACFALSVAFTMLSAQAFDPRLLWDAARTDGNE
ncbi:MAG: paraquat-inducible protein A [Pseudomonadota bacterium]